MTRLRYADVLMHINLLLELKQNASKPKDNGNWLNVCAFFPSFSSSCHQNSLSRIFMNQPVISACYLNRNVRHMSTKPHLESSISDVKLSGKFTVKVVDSTLNGWCPCDCHFFHIVYCKNVTTQIEFWPKIWLQVKATLVLGEKRRASNVRN